jgi:hypothetical protein
LLDPHMGYSGYKAVLSLNIDIIDKQFLYAP